MAITYQGAGTAAANTTSATTLAVPYPASPAAGDCIVLCVTASSATAPTNPTGAGFTSRQTGTSGGSGPSFRISTKIADGTETGNLSVTTANNTSQGRMFLFRGVDQTTPIDVASNGTDGIFGSSSSVTAYNISPLTTTMTGVALVVFSAGNSTTGNWPDDHPTVPTTFVEVWDQNQSVIPAAGAKYLIWSGSGATGTVDLTRSAGTRGAAGMIALRPASTVTNTNAPAATATGGATAPALTAGVDIAAPAAAATASIAAPSGTGGAGVTAPAATATGAVTAPSLILGVELTAPAAVGTGAVTAPTVSAGADITAPASDGVGLITAPDVGVPVVVTAVAATATGATGTPDVGGAALVVAPAVSATGAAGTPAVGANVVIAAPSAGALGGISAPDVDVEATVMAVSAGATGGVTDPSVSAGVDIEVEAASAAGTIETPGIYVPALILAAAGVATASVTAPALLVFADIQATAALAAGSMAPPHVAGYVRDITMTATLAPRRWSATLVERYTAELEPRRWKADLSDG